MPFAWGETKPSDSDIVSQHPADERATRAVVKAFADVEHDQAEGRHKFGIGNTAARDAISTFVDGSIWFNTTDGRNRLNLFSSLAWEEGAQEFVSGTIVVFHQDAAPVGWTRVLTEHADKVLLMTDGNMSASGAWAISGLTTSTVNDSHTHAVSGTSGNNNQNHTHGFSATSGTAAGSSQGTDASGGASTPLADHVHFVSGNTGNESAAHDHTISFSSGVPSTGHAHTATGDGAWRPAYISMMAAEKD